MRKISLYTVVAVLAVINFSCSLIPFHVPFLETGDQDFGDAPDPTYPSLSTSDGAHTNVLNQFWLGTLDELPTGEEDAKVVDRDERDDGLIKILATAGKIYVTFQVVKSADAPQGSVYFNLLADSNGDGRWEGSVGSIGEWIVQNMKLDMNAGDKQTADALIPLVGGNLDVWIRAMVSDAPVPGTDYPNGWDGTHPLGVEKVIGEVEDYRLGPTDIPTETPTPTYTLTQTPTLTPTPTGTIQPPYITSLPEDTATPTATYHVLSEIIELSLSSDRVRAGEVIALRGKGFTPEKQVREEFFCAKEHNFYYEVWADKNGKLFATINTTNIPPGSCTLMVIDVTTGKRERVKFQVLKP